MKPSRGSSPHSRQGNAGIIELLRGLAPINQLHVSCTTGQGHAFAISHELLDLAEPEHVVVPRFRPVLGIHLGPNIIGVEATTESTEEK